MSARMRQKRGRRHEDCARVFGCDCPRHRGRDLAAEDQQRALTELGRLKHLRPTDRALRFDGGYS